MSVPSCTILSLYAVRLLIYQFLDVSLPFANATATYRNHIFCLHHNQGEKELTRIAPEEIEEFAVYTHTYKHL